ncbi:hypothetical protein HPP92_016350 [Vanilla planifolia]|uniref:Uncharacterized protein n=1 Tax=Vanilla planifolia TaxID=51239 RepID=A0A835UQE0_VANPL|nr:hypothetical protein HPP92_016350 [Vanilla planifolia]
MEVLERIGVNDAKPMSSSRGHFKLSRELPKIDVQLEGVAKKPYVCAIGGFMERSNQEITTLLDN